jgi:hypothetical protein
MNSKLAKTLVLALVICSVPAMAATIIVDSVPGMVNANLAFTGGALLTISATGTANLANNSSGTGAYLVGPDGVIITGPQVGSGAYNWFTANADVAGVNPVTGVAKTPSAILAPLQIPNLVGVPYGYLIAGFTTNPTPALFSDFVFVPIGFGSSFLVPGAGVQNLWLGVNDTHPSNSPVFLRTDNTGSYTAEVSEVVPEPATFALLGAGLLAFSLVRRRR